MLNSFFKVVYFPFQINIDSISSDEEEFDRFNQRNTERNNSEEDAIKSIYSDESETPKQ